MKRFLCGIMALLLVSLSLVSCHFAKPTPATTAKTTSKRISTKAVTTEPAVKETPWVDADYVALAGKALESLYSNFWDYENNHFYPTGAGYIIDGRMGMTWEHGVAYLAMENYYYATKDEETLRKLKGEWEYVKGNFSRERLVGYQGQAPNIAMDDSGWTAMFCIAAYRLHGDTYALECARDNILNSYEYWKDGDLSNGLFYCDDKLYDGQQWKSIYCVSLMVSALDYCRVTKNTIYYDQNLYEQTMILYKWVEEHLCRNNVVTIENGLQDGSSYTIRTIDNLYWCDYNVNRTDRYEKNGPDGGTRPNAIGNSGSVSALFGNTGMAAIHAMLYDMTGDMEYLNRCYNVINGLERVYCNDDGGLINDRDPWTDSALMYYFVTEALTVPNVSPIFLQILRKTGYLIANFCETEDHYFLSVWEEIAYSRGDFTVLMSNATTVGMLTSVALAQSLGLFEHLDK